MLQTVSKPSAWCVLLFSPCRFCFETAIHVHCFALLHACSLLHQLSGYIWATADMTLPGHLGWASARAKPEVIGSRHANCSTRMPNLTNAHRFVFPSAKVHIEPSGYNTYKRAGYHDGINLRFVFEKCFVWIPAVTPYILMFFLCLWKYQSI